MYGEKCLNACRLFENASLLWYAHPNKVVYTKPVSEPDGCLPKHPGALGLAQ